AAQNRAAGRFADVYALAPGALGGRCAAGGLRRCQLPLQPGGERHQAAGRALEARAGRHRRHAGRGVRAAVRGQSLSACGQ
nr:hypothetical protein [Tanacetum cinerariifolium]